MSERLPELANEIVDLRNQYNSKLEVVTELKDMRQNLELKLQEMLDLTKSEVTHLKKNEVVIKGTETPTEKSGKKRDKTMGDLVVQVLELNPEGLPLKELSSKIQEMIDNKEYDTESGNIPNIVSQALNKLKAKNTITTVPSPDGKRQRYVLVKSEETEEVVENTAESVVDAA